MIVIYWAVGFLIGAIISGGLLRIFDDMPGIIEYILVIICIICVAGLIIEGLAVFLSLMLNASHASRVETCLKAFEYTREQCEYFATYGGPYK